MTDRQLETWKRHDPRQHLHDGGAWSQKFNVGGDHDIPPDYPERPGAGSGQFQSAENRSPVSETGRGTSGTA